MVYYRKYRPQTIAELDLEAVRKRLTDILSAKELPHAFLFTGPKGLGKTSSARILAKAINCEVNQEARIKKQGKKEEDKSHDSRLMIHDSNYEPCNKCDACISITNGSNIDVLEIDAASNRGIDEIRDLRDKIKYSPASLPKKVYIIDEVHMLTTDAFNALLKTLEEPPDHAIFILATTEVEKVPATIASRTFHVQFQKPSKEEIVNSLNRIVVGEKLDIEPDILNEIYKLSEGAFRDAAKILEELSIGSAGKKITMATLTDTYKTANLDVEIQNLLVNLSKKELKNSIAVVEELVNKGSDFKIVTERIAEKLHDILMLRAGIKGEVIDIKELTTSELKQLLNEINESYGRIKFSVLPQIPLELVVIGWCLPQEEESRKYQVESIKYEKKEEKGKEQIVDLNSHIEIQKEAKMDIKTTNDERSTNNETSPNPQNPHGILFSETSKPDNFLAAFLSALKNDNHSIAGVLRGCKLIEITKEKVIFETRFKFHRDRLMQPATENILNTRASQILAEKVKVIVNLIEK